MNKRNGAGQDIYFEAYNDNDVLMTDTDKKNCKANLNGIRVRKDHCLDTFIGMILPPVLVVMRKGFGKEFLICVCLVF